ncbi:helix-turn-helix transcriptional regulator [Bacteroides sp. GD17]|jgi:AraC-like DNA-binding protein|uniref:helix-turn-helix transcriptional regulator n=1 Tax=Bacteroides sp. GD17 TaxID=3139826 RepID=UPI00406C89BF
MRCVIYICMLLLGSCIHLSAQENMGYEAHMLPTEQHIRDTYVSEPKHALELLNEAEDKNSMPLYLIDELRSRVYRHMYQCELSFLYARRAYVHDSIANNNPEHLLEMTITLAELSNLLSEYKESIRYAIQGMELARENGDKQAEAKLLFCMGENKRMLSLKEEGYEYFDKAIQLLDNARDARGMRMLSYFYGVKMSYLIDDNRFADALAIGLQREKLLDRMKTVQDISDTYLDQQYEYVYSKLAYTYYMLGESAVAVRYYQKYKATEAAATPDGKYDATPYLLASGQYQAVLDHCRELKNVFRQQDTINYQYRGILQKEIKAYVALKDFGQVALLRESVIAVTDSMYLREKENAALELATLYEVNEKEARIAEQSFQLRIRNISLVFVLCLALSAFAFLWRLWFKNRAIKNKNRVLVQYINEQLSLQASLDQSHENSQLSASLSLPDGEEGEETDDETAHEVNKMVFQKLDFLIRKEKLYLSTDLSRDDLAKRVHMNNTRFAKMIKENTGTNLNGYINNIRLKHAIQLLKEHPEYTLRAIAEASGINSMPTFHNLFKSKTGMTPAEFKNTQSEFK